MEIKNIVEKILASELYGFSIAGYIIPKAFDIGTGLLWEKWKEYLEKAPKSLECQLYDAIEASVKAYSAGSYVTEDTIACCCEIIYGKWIVDGCVTERNLQNALEKLQGEYIASRKLGFWYSLFYEEILKREELSRWFQIYSLGILNKRQDEIEQLILELKNSIDYFQDDKAEEKGQERLNYEKALRTEVLKPVMDEKFSLKDIYISLYGKLIRRTWDNTTTPLIVDTTSYVMEWIHNDDSNMLCIHGEPGSGKSSLTKMIAAAVCASEKFAGSIVFVDLFRVPFLHDQPVSKSLEEYIRKKAPWFFLSKDSETRLLILDGLDEIKHEVYKNAKKLVQEVESYFCEFPCKIIVSGRTQVMMESISDVSCEVLEVLHLFLDEDDSDIYISDVYDSDEMLPYDLRQGFWNTLTRHFGVEHEMPVSNRRFNELSKSPLLLFLVVWTIKHTDIQFETLKNTAELYEKIFQCIYTRKYNRASEKEYYYKPEEYREYQQMLHYLGACAYRNNSKVVSISKIYEYCMRMNDGELCNHWIQKHKDDNPSKLVLFFFLRENQNNMDWEDSEIEFIHKTFYEYLAAVAILEFLFRYSKEPLLEKFPFVFFYLCSENVITEEIKYFIAEIIKNQSLNVDGTIIGSVVYKDMIERMLSCGYGNDYPITIGCRDKYNQNVDAKSYMDAVEKVHIYEGSIAALISCYSNLWKRESGFINLNGMKFHNINMLRWSLRGFSFEESLFSEGTFAGTTFEDCNLKKTLFGDITADRAIFRNVVLDETDFTLVNLAAADFTGNTFNRTIFQSAVLEGAYFVDGILREVNFQYANLVGANFDDAVLENVDFTSADLTNADLINISVKHVTWNNCIMLNAKLDGVQMIQFDLNDASIKEMLVEADLTNADWTGVDEELVEEYLSYTSVIK